MRVYPIAVAAAVFAMSASATAQSIVAWAENPSNGHYYAMLEPACWTDAQARAVELGGNLATVRNQAENDWLANTFGVLTPSGVLSIGFYQDKQDPNYAEPAGGWKWISGEAVTFTDWAQGEPNNVGPDSEFCFMEITRLDGWNDNQRCEFPEYAVIELTSVPILTTATEPTTGNMYALLPDSYWTAAEAMAVSLGGHLATIGDQAEHDWIANTFGLYGGVDRYLWIGFFQDITDPSFSEPGGGWKWISGEAVTFINWAPSEPNDNTEGSEFCLMFWAWHDGLRRWNDIPDNAEGRGITGVVELPPLDIDTSRTRYDRPTQVTITGSGFASGGAATVLFDATPATNIVVVDDTTITCDTPVVEPGQLDVDVTVTNDNGTGTLVDVFTFTPALKLTGNWVVGGDLTLTYLLDPNDSIFAIYGLPPVQGFDTPPFDGQLCILPFYTFFILTGWPFDTWDQTFGIPNNPNLSGLDVLFQGLIGPSFGNPKDAAWTNCATLSIQ